MNSLSLSTDWDNLKRRISDSVKNLFKRGLKPTAGKLDFIQDRNLRTQVFDQAGLNSNLDITDIKKTEGCSNSELSGY